MIKYNNTLEQREFIKRYLEELKKLDKLKDSKKEEERKKYLFRILL